MLGTVCAKCKSKAKRLTGKSPHKSSAKKKTAQGFSYLDNGEPFINGWPTDRKPVNMNGVPTQSVEESADWASKANKFLHKRQKKIPFFNQLVVLETIMQFVPC